jgi:hypothetical protein
MAEKGAAVELGGDQPVKNPPCPKSPIPLGTESLRNALAQERESLASKRTDFQTLYLLRTRYFAQNRRQATTDISASYKRTSGPE